VCLSLTAEWQIEKKHVTLLEEMVAKHQLKNLDKAFRVAVQFSITDGRYAFFENNIYYRRFLLPSFHSRQFSLRHS